MPCNYKEYPDNWKQIIAAKKVKHNNKCELCYAPNGQYVLRGVSKLEQYPWYPYCHGYSERGFRKTKIVLTVHHIDGDKTNNSEQNLLLSCQKCHLRLDLEKHMKKRMAKK